MILLYILATKQEKREVAPSEIVSLEECDRVRDDERLSVSEFVACVSEKNSNFRGNFLNARGNDSENNTSCTYSSRKPSVRA